MGGKLSVLMMTYALQPSFRRERVCASERERERLGKVFDHIGLGSYGGSKLRGMWSCFRDDMCVGLAHDLEAWKTLPNSVKRSKLDGSAGFRE
jgi:hypothetical protein